MVSRSMSSIEIETLFTFFFFIEKFDRKSHINTSRGEPRILMNTPFIRNYCNLLHVYEWIEFFVSM